MTTKPKILILDDSADLLDALKLFLEYESFTVCTVTSEDLLKTELKRFKPDVIILDVYIHGHADGRNICKIIKSNKATTHIPVILMSVSKNGLEKFKECKANAVIEKPFDLSELLQKIRSLTKNNIKKIIFENRKQAQRVVSSLITSV